MFLRTELLVFATNTIRQVSDQSNMRLQSYALDKELYAARLDRRMSAGYHMGDPRIMTNFTTYNNVIY